MNKPLTLEELKALKVNDYVWIVYLRRPDCYNEYIQKASMSTDDYLANELDIYDGYLKYSSYGTTWVAYKNKEIAEDRGLFLPCKFGDIIYKVYDKCDGRCCPFNGDYGQWRCSYKGKRECKAFYDKEEFTYRMIGSIGETIFINEKDARVKVETLNKKRKG